MIILSLRAPKGRSNLYVKIASSLYYVTLLAMTMSGCQTAPKNTSFKSESSKEVIKAIGTVTEGVTNQPMSQEDLKKLAEQMEKNPEARTAVESVNQALNAHQAGVKYCPNDGRRFSNRVTNCPDCGALLKDVE